MRPYFAPATGFGSGQYIDTSLITSCVIRDNIGMSQVDRANWVRNPPPSFSGTWDTANAASYYGGPVESPFTDSERAMLLYREMYGTRAANGGTVATHRFIFPHGYMARSDAFMGAGA